MMVQRLEEMMKRYYIVNVFIYDYMCLNCQEDRVLLTPQYEEIPEKLNNICVCGGNYIRKVGPPKFVEGRARATI